MQPEKPATVDGHKITEYYWNGRIVTYVDNCIYSGSYSQAIHEYGGYETTRTS